MPVIQMIIVGKIFFSPSTINKRIQYVQDAKCTVRRVLKKMEDCLD